MTFSFAHGVGRFARRGSWRIMAAVSLDVRRSAAVAGEMTDP